MLNVLEQGPDFWHRFSYHCVHPIHAQVFSIQMLLLFSQIAQMVCTLVLFIFNINYFLQMKLLRFAKTRSCHVYVFSRMTVIAEALEGKKNEDSHEDTKQLLQKMSRINRSHKE